MPLGSGPQSIKLHDFNFNHIKNMTNTVDLHNFDRLLLYGKKTFINDMSKFNVWGKISHNLNLNKQFY